MITYFSLASGFLTGKYKKNRECLFAGDYYHISKSPSWIEKIWYEPIYNKPHNYLCGGNIIVDKNTFNNLGGFNENFETGEDVEFCRRFTDRGGNILIDDKLYIYHEGYPKTLKHFFLKERWHGKSDFYSVKSILSSNVAIATILFSVLHLLLFGSIFLQPTLSLVCAIVIFGLIMLNSYKKNKKLLSKSFLLSLPISYVYFCGRVASIFNR